VFCLKKVSNIVGSQVICFEDEARMLEAWQQFVAEVDPDVVIGYNISGFDLPYLMDRAKAIKAEKFPYLGRIQSTCFHLVIRRSSADMLFQTRRQW
jgi:DNA polymerase delta subunit 1